MDLFEIWDRFVQLLNDPSVRAFTSVLSVISFFVSIWAVRQMSTTMASHKASVRSEQARFLEMQWSTIDQLTVSNPDCARLAVEMFGIENETEAKREALHYMYLNVLGAAFMGWKNKAIDEDVYDGHMKFFFNNYKGPQDFLVRLIRNGGFLPGFEAECVRYMNKARGT